MRKSFVAGLAALMVSGVAFADAGADATSPLFRVIEAGQPPVHIHETVQGAWLRRALHPEGVIPNSTVNGSGNLAYGGGPVGTEHTPVVYLVFYGSQWSSDTYNEKTILQNFFNSVGGSSFANIQTQYCDGVATGATSCGSSGTHVTNPVGQLAGVWSDTSVKVSTYPSQSNLANEAVKAAAHFGNTSSSVNNNVQYVIALPHGIKPSGFKTQYCAYHSAISSSYGTVAWTNLPYITDAGSGCGAGIVNSPGTTDGITIVEGHEYAESVTDQFPITTAPGWTDSSGYETGDKCAWVSGSGAAKNLTFPNGQTFPVQSLYSNASSSCVFSY